jgi:hypothetical protein
VTDVQENTFAVLGDLGNDTYVVRMFVGDATYDEEITCPLGELRATSRSAWLSKPDAKRRVDAQRPHPALDNGHAVEVP